MDFTKYDDKGLRKLTERIEKELQRRALEAVPKEEITQLRGLVERAQLPDEIIKPYTTNICVGFSVWNKKVSATSDYCNESPEGNKLLENYRDIKAMVEKANEEMKRVRQECKRIAKKYKIDVFEVWDLIDPKREFEWWA
jgi:hypothetical protein